MKTIQDVLVLSTEHLQKKGIKNPRRQAEEVISDALEITRMALYMRFECPLTEPELIRCREAVMRRAHGEPVQYIRGSVDFLNCCIKVNRNVLIPRPETEILAERIIQELADEDVAGKVLWDVCCGSGCLGIAIKKKIPQLKVVLSDLSEKALAIAKENAESNEVEVTCLQGDLLSPFVGKKADYVVSNPPYISEKELEDLEIEVKKYEPQGALLAGKTGLEFYQRLANELPKYLNNGAQLWLEIGSTQGPAVSSLFSNPPWTSCLIAKDWAGHDRFAFVRMQAVS